MLCGVNNIKEGWRCVTDGWNKYREIIGYYVGCVGNKIVVVYMINYDSPVFIYYFGVAYIFIAIRYLYLFAFEIPTTELKIWLNRFRPVHILLYLVFSLYVLRGYTVDCWKFLVGDLVFGVTTYTVFLVKPRVVCSYDTATIPV